MTRYSHVDDESLGYVVECLSFFDLECEDIVLLMISDEDAVSSQLLSSEMKSLGNLA